MSNKPTNSKEEWTAKEHQLVRDWLSSEDPIAIATHMNVDADAAFSAALLKVMRPRASLRFVRADSIIRAKNTIAVDLSRGSRAVKGLSPGSAFGLVVEVLRDIDHPVYESFKLWAAQLNKTDSGRRCNDPVRLCDLVHCWRARGMSDEQIVERAEEILEGRLINSKRNSEQFSIAEKVIISDGVALLDNVLHVRAVDLFKLGALAVVRESNIGMCINLSREAQRKGLSLRELKDKLPPSWFIHPHGFLACYGSAKARKNPKKSGLKLNRLAKIVTEWLDERITACPQ